MRRRRARACDGCRGGHPACPSEVLKQSGHHHEVRPSSSKQSPSLNCDGAMGQKCAALCDGHCDLGGLCGETAMGAGCRSLAHPRRGSSSSTYSDRDSQTFTIVPQRSWCASPYIGRLWWKRGDHTTAAGFPPRRRCAGRATRADRSPLGRPESSRAGLAVTSSIGWSSVGSQRLGIRG